MSGRLYVNGTSMSNVVPEGGISNLVFDVGNIHAVHSVFYKGHLIRDTICLGLFGKKYWDIA